jgi:hypothetical protein
MVRGVPLEDQVPGTFCHLQSKEWSVFKVMRDGGIKLTFRRNFGNVEEQE